MQPEVSPFAVSKVERRVALAQHLVPVVEALVEGGTAYANLTVARIIEAGGISRAAFYKYFDDKADLLVAMADGVIGDLIATGGAWWALPPTGGKADLRKALAVPLIHYRDNRMILGAVVEAATYDERVRVQQHRLIGDVTTALSTHIADGQRAGSVHRDLDPQRTATWLVWMLERGLFQEVTLADPSEASALMDAVTEILWRVLYDGHRDVV